MDIPRPNTPTPTFFKAFVGIWIAAILLSLTLAGGIIYAAIHFISKYW